MRVARFVVRSAGRPSPRRGRPIPPCRPQPHYIRWPFSRWRWCVPPPQSDMTPLPAIASASLTAPTPCTVYVQHPAAAYSATVVNVPLKGASGFGIASLVIAIVAVLFCWVPLVGILAIPLALIAGLLAVIGIIVSLVGRKSASGSPWPAASSPHRDCGPVLDYWRE